MAELGQADYDDAIRELAYKEILAEQHQDRMVCQDREFIEMVLRPAASIRKIRALLKARPALPLLTF